MGKIALGLTVMNGKVELKMKMKEATSAELSLVYVNLDVLKDNLKSQIIKLSEFKVDDGK